MSASLKPDRQASPRRGDPEINAKTRSQIRDLERDASEALLLREVFPEILASHYDQVWNQLRRRGLLGHEAEDLVQEVFLALHNRGSGLARRLRYGGHATPTIR